MSRTNPGVLAGFCASQDHRTSDLTFANKRHRDGIQSSHSDIQQQSQNRMYGSAGTTSAAPDLISHYCQQVLGIDALVRLQVERMRFELEAVSKRQCRDLLSVLRRQVLNRIADKDAEIDRASRRNADLEQMMKELTVARQIWFTAAKNSEALACNLKSTLELALQNAASTALSDDCDAESCCYQGVDEREELRRRTACKVCGEKQVCALILPCRHLCSCKDCEPTFDTCPVCHSAKAGCLQIFLS